MCCGFDAGTFKGQAAAAAPPAHSLTAVQMSSQPLTYQQRNARGQGAGQGFEEVGVSVVGTGRLRFTAFIQLSWHGHFGAQTRHSSPLIVA